MIETIFFGPEIKRRLELLQRSDKKAALAAAKAEDIIQRIRSGEAPRWAGTITKYGEARIKGVMKYDLGSGYRMVTFKQGNHIFLLFIGSHDDCHRWIENNRELAIDQIENRHAIFSIMMDADHSIGSAGHASCDSGAEEDYDPLQYVKEGDLRKIFCGLSES